MQPLSIPPQELLRIADPRPIVRHAALDTFGGNCGRPILDRGRTIGTRYETDNAEVCFLEEIAPENSKAPREAQTLSIFETIERVLLAEGMEFKHLARTWFYLDRILDWYDAFNRARTPFLQARGAFEGLMPASTGIGMPNRFGAAAVAGAMAIRCKNGASVREVPSPLQCPALDYKSSFSRAVEIERGGRRELYISGTASIEPGGKTAHVGDTKKQIELTMQVVAAILQSRQMDWSDVCRGIAYFRQAEDVGSFTRLCAIHGVPTAPILCAENYICRDDLLFELELDAAVTGAGA